MARDGTTHANAIAPVIIGSPGRLAQLGERFAYTEEVAGSSPAPPIAPSA